MDSTEVEIEHLPGTIRSMKGECLKVKTMYLKQSIRMVAKKHKYEQWWIIDSVQELPRSEPYK